MTTDEYLALTDRERDALVAEKVMGWKCVANWEGDNPYDPTDSIWEDSNGNTQGNNPWPAYSTDIAAAWEVVERLDPEWAIAIDNNDEPGSGWFAAVARGGVCMEATAATAPAAICLAALRAVGAVKN